MLDPGWSPVASGFACFRIPLNLPPLMPWTGKQHRLFEAAAHSPAVASRVGIPQGKAAQMAGEGVKKVAKGKVLANAARAVR